jgi:hypothetical protein
MEQSMKRTLWLAALMAFAAGRPAWAQQDELARLKAELAAQQAIIARLIQQVEELEKKQTQGVTREELEAEAKTQQEAVDSVRETLLSRVNLNGYYNFRFSADGSPTPIAFQQHHLGILMGKQIGRFNFLMELELQNVPHHPEISRPEGSEGEEHAEAIAAAVGEAGTETGMDVSGEGQVAVENAWMEYNHNRYLNVRVGKQLSPQYWWQNHYPNLTYSTALPIHLRELFPAELVGAMVQGTLARPVGTSELGIGYKLYVANNQFEGNSQADLSDAKSWGGRLQLRFPTGGLLKRFDVAADLYRGRIALVTQELVEDHVVGFESQIEIDRFLLNTEYARGRTLERTRFGYYVQPAVRLHEDWIGFYRLERLESPRIHRAEERHLAGLNYRPFPQIALKGEFYRSRPLDRSFTESEGEQKPFNGFATAAVFFF